jgi:hypothetical protein
VPDLACVMRLDCRDGVHCQLLPIAISYTEIHLPQPPNYRQQKKQREQAKKKKNDEKRLRKGQGPTPTDGVADATDLNSRR